MIWVKEVIVTEFKNIIWDLAKLEGENNSLEEWRKVHKNFFSKIMIQKLYLKYLR